MIHLNYYRFYYFSLRLSPYLYRAVISSSYNSLILYIPKPWDRLYFIITMRTYCYQHINVVCDARKPCFLYVIQGVVVESLENSHIGKGKILNHKLRALFLITVCSVILWLLRLQCCRCFFLEYLHSSLKQMVYNQISLRFYVFVLKQKIGWAGGRVV